MHFHRTGVNGAVQQPAEITGSVVLGSPGWGFVNHDSYVVMEDNVSYNVVGAGFVTEIGNEIGAFRRNLAMRSTGSGDNLESRLSLFDFGHQGHGFWFQGPGVEVVDNIAAGHADAGFIYYTRVAQADFETVNLPDPSIAGGASTMKVGDVPIFKFQGNEAFAVKNGFKTWFHLTSSNLNHDGFSFVRDFSVWATRSDGIVIPYTARVNFRDVFAYNDLDHPRFSAVTINSHTEDITYHNVNFEGWEIGIEAPFLGQINIINGYFNNVTNILIHNAKGNERVIRFMGQPGYGWLSSEALDGRQQWKIDLQYDLSVKDHDVAELFAPDVVIREDGQQIYYLEQQPDFIPFKAGDAEDYVPSQFIGKTNEQLWAQYGLAIAGAVSPRVGIRNSRINGHIAIPSPIQPHLKLRSEKYTNLLPGYRLIYEDTVGSRVYDQDLIDLQEGWNVITRTIDGQERSFLVYGDLSDPYFVPKPNSPLVIHPAQLGNGFTVDGYIYDDSTGRKNFDTRFSGADLLALPIITRRNGSQYVELEFSIGDRAGNRVDVLLRLELDPNA